MRRCASDSGICCGLARATNSTRPRPDSRLDTTRKVTDRGRFEEQTHRYGGVEGAAEP